MIFSIIENVIDPWVPLFLTLDLENYFKKHTRNPDVVGKLNLGNLRIPEIKNCGKGAGREILAMAPQVRQVDLPRFHTGQASGHGPEVRGGSIGLSIGTSTSTRPAG